MVFVSILNQAEVTSNSTYLDLRVIQSSGISVVPNVNINITDLNDNVEYRYKHFFNSGDGGITIKFDIIILEDDMINGEYVTDYRKNSDSGSSQSNTTGSSTTNSNGTENVSEKIIRTPADKMSLYRSFIESRKSIYDMIFNDLEDLFYKIY